MGRLRLRISDGTQDKVRGALENAARLELEIAAFGVPAVMRVRSNTGALLSLASVGGGARVDVRSSPWQDWPLHPDPVDRLSLAVKAASATEPHLRAELANVDQVVLRPPPSVKEAWEVVVISGQNHRTGLIVQSVFTIFTL